MTRTITGMARCALAVRICAFMRRNLLLVCLALAMSSPACTQVYVCTADSAEGGCKGPNILNPRIEVQGQPSLRQSNTIWLRSGEELIALWDTYTYEIFKGDEACDFSNFTEATDDCELCDLCSSSTELEQLCPRFGGAAVPDLKLVSYEGFTTDAAPASILMLRPVSGCGGLGFPPVTFSPLRNATYQILQPLTLSGTEQEVLIAEKKVFVIGETSQTTTYEMERYVSEPPIPPSMWPKVWYRWSINSSEVWEDNFTSFVRVGKVRILTGRAGTDPVTGSFRLEDARPVRPSRVLFLRLFLEGDPRSPNDILAHGDDDDLRCYADAATNDGNIEIPRCRRNPGDPTPSGTPAVFLLNPNLYDGEPLTWIAEFNEAEGADFDPTTSTFDPVPANALLAIELTIEKVP